MSSSFIVLSSKRQSVLKDFFLIVAMSLVLGMSSSAAIFLPFSPVPIALQPHLVLLFAALFGSTRAFLITLAFIIQGCAGLPVFAGGVFGFAHLLGPRGGYIIGYLFATLAVGKLMAKKRGSLQVFSAMAAGNGVIYLFGLLYLSLFLPFSKAFLVGVLPFLPGDFFKLILLTKLIARRT